MRKTYRFSTSNMINHLPLAITPHTAALVSNDNPYLPAAHRKRSNGEVRQLYDFPKINWRAGVPVIPATSIKGSLRHLLSDEAVNGAVGIDIDIINSLAIGGVRQKKTKPGETDASTTEAEDQATIAQSPTEIERMRSSNPLIGVFGASDPIFVTSGFTMFGDAIPLEVFELEEIPIVRTNPIVRDLGAMRAADASSIDAKMGVEAASSARSKDAKALTKAIESQLRAARKNGTGEVSVLEAKLAAAKQAEKEVKAERIVQTGQIQTRIAIPAGVAFRHHFQINATDDELALLIGALAAFGVQREGKIGSSGQGCGGNLAFTYDIEVEEGSFPTVGWTNAGQIGVRVDAAGGRNLIANGIAREALDKAGEIMKKIQQEVALAA